MSRLTKKDKKWIQDTFGERANFNRTERILYSHDIAAVLSLFKPLVRNTLPDVPHPVSKASSAHDAQSDE